MSEHIEFDKLIDMYDLGSVPIEGWATDDLVALANLIDVELQLRADADAVYTD